MRWTRLGAPSAAALGLLLILILGCGGASTDTSFTAGTSATATNASTATASTSTSTSSSAGTTGTTPGTFSGEVEQDQNVGGSTVMSLVGTLSLDVPSSGAATLSFYDKNGNLIDTLSATPSSGRVSFVDASKGIAFSGAFGTSYGGVADAGGTWSDTTTGQSGNWFTWIPVGGVAAMGSAGISTLRSAGVLFSPAEGTQVVTITGSANSTLPTGSYGYLVPVFGSGIDWSIVVQSDGNNSAGQPVQTVTVSQMCFSNASFAATAKGSLPPCGCCSVAVAKRGSR